MVLAEEKTEADETAVKVARRLSGKPSCPDCGYAPSEGETLPVADWNLRSGRAVLEDGELRHWDLECTDTYMNKDEITCPECGIHSPKKDWGIE